MREGGFFEVRKKEGLLHSDLIEMIKQDSRALLKPNFPPVIAKSYFKLDECKVISSQLIAMGTVL